MKRLGVTRAGGRLLLFEQPAEENRNQGELAIDHIGFDLGKVNSQLCIITGAGELIERRISTSRESLAKLLGSRPSAHILIEAATESEWVARHLEGLGHEPRRLTNRCRYGALLLSAARRLSHKGRVARRDYAAPGFTGQS